MRGDKELTDEVCKDLGKIGLNEVFKSNRFFLGLRPKYSREEVCLLINRDSQKFVWDGKECYWMKDFDMLYTDMLMQNEWQIIDKDRLEGERMYKYEREEFRNINLWLPDVLRLFMETEKLNVEGKSLMLMTNKIGVMMWNYRNVGLTDDLDENTILLMHLKWVLSAVFLNRDIELINKIKHNV